MSYPGRLLNLFRRFMKKVVLYLFLSIQACQPVFAQSYLKGPALIEGVTVTATAAGTTTLTKDSQTVQTLTGSTTQTIILPDATTLPVGRYFEFYNLSSGAVTVNYNGGSLARTIIPSGHSKITLTANGTAAGDWAIEKITIAFSDSLLTGTLGVDKGGTGVASTTAYGVLAGGTTSTGALQNIGVGSSGQILTSNGAGVLPSFQAAPVSTTLTTKGDIQTYSTVNDRLGVGTNDQILIADSGATTGLNWANRDAANYLLNPSFEHTTATTSWTQGSGTSCAAETTEVSDGTKSLLCTLTAATAASVYQDVTPTVKMSGINFEYGVWIKTASTTLSVCARQAAATVGSCTTVIGDNVWHYYPINYPGPSSGSVGVSVVPLSSTTGTYYIDAGYVGKARNIGTVAQASFFGGMEQAGAGSCIYSENTSTGTSDFKDLGSSSGCNAWTTSGSVTATGTNDHRPVLANLAPGTYQVSVSGTFLNDTANQLCAFRLSDGTTTYQPQTVAGPNAANGVSVPTLTFSVPYTTPQSSITLKLQASDNGAGSCSLYNVANLNAAWKIYYFPSAAQTVVNMNQSGWYVDATMDGANPDLGVSNVSSYTEITNASLTLKPQSGSAAVGVMCSSTNAATAPSTGNTTCAAGSESVGINFSIPTPGSYEVCWYGSSYKVVDGSEAVNTTLQLIETPTNAQTLTLEGGTRQLSSSGNATAGVIDSVVTDAITNCSVFNWTSSGIKGVRLMYEQAVSGTPDSSLLFADEDGATGQRNMRFTVKPITTAMPMPLLVGGVTSNTSGMERVERAFINGGTVSTDCSSSPCTVTSQSGTWITSVTRSGTGTYTVNIATGIFSAQPNCTGTAETGSAYGSILQRVSAGSSTSLQILTLSSPTTTADMRFSIICQGPR